MLGWLTGGFMKHLLAIVGINAAESVAKDALSATTKTVHERIKKDEEYRDELAAILMTLDDGDTQNLRSHWLLIQRRGPKPYAVPAHVNANYKPGDEMTFIRSLIGIRMHVGGKKEATAALSEEEHKRFEETIYALNKMNPEERDAWLLERLKNDSGYQWLMKTLRTVNNAAEAISTNVTRPAVNAGWNQLNAWRVRRGLPPVHPPF